MARKKAQDGTLSIDLPLTQLHSFIVLSYLISSIAPCSNSSSSKNFTDNVLVEELVDLPRRGRRLPVRAGHPLPLAVASRLQFGVVVGLIGESIIRRRHITVTKRKSRTVVP